MGYCCVDIAWNYSRIITLCCGYVDRVGTYAMMQRIYNREGFFAFYRGLSASLLGLSHVAIQFPLCKFLSV